MKRNLFKTICGAVALAAGAVMIIVNTIATVANTVPSMSANDVIAFLSFGVAALGILSLQRA